VPVGGRQPPCTCTININGTHIDTTIAKIAFDFAQPDSTIASSMLPIIVRGLLNVPSFSGLISRPAF